MYDNKKGKYRDPERSLCNLGKNCRHLKNILSGEQM